MLVLLVLLGLVTLLTFRLDRRQPELDADKRTALALAEAKEALLGDSASNNDPGILICPSMDGTQGTANTVAMGPIKCGSVLSQSNIGWLPWKSLGTGELRDGSASLLWYMLSEAYVDKGTYSPPPNAATLQVTVQVVVVNPGNLSETIISSTLFPNAAGVIIAPGPPLPGQSRTGAALTDSSYSTAYLGVTANSAANTLTIKVEQKQNSPPLKYNDQYLLITRQEILERSTPSVAAAFATALSNYFITNGNYPATGWLPAGGVWGGSQTYAGWVQPVAGVYPTTYQNTGVSSGTVQFSSCGATFNITQSASGAQVTRTGHC